MAWVTSVEKNEGSGKLHPTELVAHAKVFRTEDGRPIVQIDTLGSDNREKPGKQSQTLQFGREAAHQLYEVLKTTYGF